MMRKRFEIALDADTERAKRMLDRCEVTLDTGDRLRQPERAKRMLDRCEVALEADRPRTGLGARGWR